MEYLLFKTLFLVICMFFTGWEIFKMIACIEVKRQYNAIGWIFVSLLWGFFYFLLNN